MKRLISVCLFLTCCLCMNGSIVLFQSQLGALQDYAYVLGMHPFVFILVILVTFNFFIEFAVNLILEPAIHRVIGVVDKRFKGNKK